MRNTFERAVWTFVQGFVGSLSVDALLPTDGFNETRALLVALAAATLSALKTLAQDRLSQLDRSEG